MPDPDAAPDTPIDLRTAMIAAHEQYTAMRAAGFSRLEALWLTANVICGGPKPPEDKEAD